ncbi:peptidoglycan DD-metalloendopeptidase family protein [Pueribacillus sp. YX66]|uniref:peptidoglycan DD-metalloendopeptidase family protein n=1 Tax=Pueribacillus sp. YX66 TaxID=3229242 RepID=UPI00358D4B27
MNEFIKRVFLAMAMAVCISLLFVGVKVTNAQSNNNWYWPTEGVLTDTFGTRGGTHYGIDIAAEIGTPVYASESGKVVKSYFSHSYGNVIFIQHKNEMETVYAHLHKRLVAEGDTVKKGDQIGEVGNTGRSSGSHLHFEVHDGPWDIHKSTAINPLLVLSTQDDSKLANEEKEITVSKANSKYEYIKRETITVQEGDTLWDLSQKYDIEVKDIMKWNNLDSSLILIGQELVIHKFEKM